MSALSALLVRDMRLAVRLGGGAPIGVLFFLIVVTLMPFAIGADLALLQRIGPAVLWLGALLASLLALDRLFATDHEDGSLDLLLMSPIPLELAVAAKALAHWVTTGLPLVIAAPVLALLLNLDPWPMARLANDNAHKIVNGVPNGTGPMTAALAAATPKISTGIVSGSTRTGNSNPPRRSATESAAPTAPISVRAGVPASNVSATAAIALASILSINPSTGAAITSGSPVVIHCAAAFVSTTSSSGSRAVRITSSEPSL